jgi:hypothetical protein
MTTEIMDVCTIDKRTYDNDTQEYSNDDVPLVKKSRLDNQQQ